VWGGVRSKKRVGEWLGLLGLGFRFRVRVRARVRDRVRVKVRVRWGPMLQPVCCRLNFLNN
jgi:hypothetical protein